jgi:glycosyltransferase involved in cell wall biosynthesis
VEQIAATGPDVVHVISDAGPHPFFTTLIEAGGFPRERLAVGCIGPAGALQREMARLGVASFALGATRRSQYPVAVVRLARLLRRCRADIVHTHLVDGCAVGLSAARLARTPVSAMTAHHSHELPYHGRRLIWADTILTGLLADHVIAPSVSVVRTLERYAHTRPGKIDVVHHGFDLEAIAAGADRRDHWRKSLGLDGRTVIGCIGRLYRLKNQAALIDAFAQVARECETAQLLIAGPGDPEPLRARAAAAGVGDQVTFAGPVADVPGLLAACDAFAHPALAESFGMVIVEAMAAGLPVLCTPVGIAPELIEPGVTGIRCEDATAQSLEWGLRALLAMRAAWPELGAVAAASVAGFNATAMAGRYEQLYRRWLQEPSRFGGPRSPSSGDA